MTEFSDGLRELIRAATRMKRNGTPLESIPEAEQISDRIWQLGLTGARLDQLMTSTLGIHAPVIAAYEALDGGTEVPSGERPGSDTQDVAAVPRVAKLDVVLRGLGGHSTAEIAAIVDEVGEQLFRRLTEEGCLVTEWGSTIEDYEEGDE